jgi:hypothetical protein
VPERSAGDSTWQPTQLQTDSYARVVPSCAGCHVGSVGYFERGTGLLAMTEQFLSCQYPQDTPPADSLTLTVGGLYDIEYS